MIEKVAAIARIERDVIDLLISVPKTLAIAVAARDQPWGSVILRQLRSPPCVGTNRGADALTIKSLIAGPFKRLALPQIGSYGRLCAVNDSEGNF